MAHRSFTGRSSRPSPAATVQDSDQKEAVRVATLRVREAEAKIEIVKKWVSPLQHAIDEYHGKSRPARRHARRPGREEPRPARTDDHRARSSMSGWRLRPPWTDRNRADPLDLSLEADRTKVMP